MDVLPGIQSRSLFRGHLEEHPVSGPEQQHRAPGRLVQEMSTHLTWFITVLSNFHF